MPDLRMPELNKVFLAGRLAADPDLQYLPSGTAVCKMRVASTRRFKTRDGEQRDENMFINVTAWAKSAEFCGEYMRKGTPVLVEGELRMNEWEDKNTGQKRSAIEINSVRIQSLEWADRDGGRSGSRDSGRSGGDYSQDAPSPRPRPVEEDAPPEDDIPF